jgi:hypothetical protein
MNKAYINTVFDKYALGNVAGMGYQVPAKETPFCEAAFKLEVDKCEKIRHPFTPFYFDLFNSQRRSIRKVVQIGVESKRRVINPENKVGASLRLWHEFFPSAEIYGSTPNPDLLFTDRKIKTVLCDQSKSEELEALVKETGANVDLFVDYGAKDPDEQVQMCLTLMPLLQKDVIYIIENVVDLDIERRLMKYNTRLISLRASNGRRYPNDKMLVVRNKEQWS